MITVLLVCTIVAGALPTLTPLTGWELVRVTGQPADATTELIPLPGTVRPTLAPGAMQPPGLTQCTTLVDKHALACPKMPQGGLAQQAPPAEQLEVTWRRTVLVGDDVQAPKGCTMRVEPME